MPLIIVIVVGFALGCWLLDAWAEREWPFETKTRKAVKRRIMEK